MATEVDHIQVSDSPTGWWVDLPLTDYQAALDLQLAVVAAKIDGRLDADVVLILEHPRVFTLGRRGGRENLCVKDEFLAAKSVRVIPTGRGGNITYHGPGQLVVYPIVHLSRHRLKVVEFVSALEEAMIRTAGHWSVPAGTDPANRGVWIGADKLGSVGITVRRGVSFHGLALNVNTDMEPFGWIHPCGLAQVRMTSCEQYLGRPVPMAEARRVMAGHLAECLGLTLTTMDVVALCEKLGHRVETMSTAPCQMSSGG
ncbi:Octanoyltransferase [Desulfosarcina cetonica]|uniref:lipoyl(octanoyl) transferase LipB n=1 Tax=Desulfosarcina cetonica TaxID=90730 RepID=UPI0006D0D8F4|nr:lipoyl(octanoyl) transferase LipB [Desulfosarcina cetonica]VTR69402.1 Octanoyltransferase [Desulfosarcina cetonica]